MPRATRPEISCHRPSDCTGHPHDVVERAGRVLDYFRRTIDAWSLPSDRTGPDVRDEPPSRVDSTRSAHPAAQADPADTRRDGPSSRQRPRRGREAQSAQLRLVWA